MLPGTVLEPVSECFLASLIIGWAAHYVFRYTVDHTGMRSLVDWAFIVLQPQSPKNRLNIYHLDIIQRNYCILICVCVCVCVCFRWDMMVFFMCHCLAWFISDYIQLTGVQVISHTSNLKGIFFFNNNYFFIFKNSETQI